VERGARVARRQSPGDRHRREQPVAEEQHRDLARFGYALVSVTSM
jgi:hypothetical protein